MSFNKEYVFCSLVRVCVQPARPSFYSHSANFRKLIICTFSFLQKVQILLFFARLVDVTNPASVASELCPDLHVKPSDIVFI